MSEVRLQLDDWSAGGQLPRIETSDSERLTDRQGNWRCPICGGLTFTAREEIPGRLVLSCFREPTHIGFPIGRRNDHETARTMTVDG